MCERCLMNLSKEELVGLLISADTQLDELNKQNARLKETLHNEQGIAMKAIADIKQLTIDNQILKLQLGEARNQLNAAARENNALANRMRAGYEKELNTLKERNANLTSNCQELAAQNAALSLMTKEAIDAMTENQIDIVKVIFDEPTTKVYFSDGSKSIVKVADGEKFNKTTGFVLAILKRVLGTKDYYETIRFIFSQKTADKVIDVKALKAKKAKEKATADAKEKQSTTTKKTPASTKSSKKK